MSAFFARLGTPFTQTYEEDTNRLLQSNRVGTPRVRVVEDSSIQGGTQQQQRPAGKGWKSDRRSHHKIANTVDVGGSSDEEEDEGEGRPGAPRIPSLPLGPDVVGQTDLAATTGSIQLPQTQMNGTTNSARAHDRPPQSPMYVQTGAEMSGGQPSELRRVSSYTAAASGGGGGAGRKLYSSGALTIVSSSSPTTLPGNVGWGVVRPAAMTPRSRMRNCRNFLVIGPRQVGKSSLINAYRLVNTGNTKWPVAPVGLCGRFGTSSVDPCPNNPNIPSWLLVDTPGRLYSDLHNKGKHGHATSEREGSQEPTTGTDETPVAGLSGTNDEPKLTDPSYPDYDGDDAMLLSLLFEGLPWKTRLVGPQGLPVSSLSELPAQPLNRAHHSILVLSATDLITATGPYWWPSYKRSQLASKLVAHLADLLDYVRSLLNDRPPYIVITHMDLFRWRTDAEELIKTILTCVPHNRLYFVELPPDTGLEDNSSSRTGANKWKSLSQTTVSTLLKLHQDILSDVCWLYGGTGGNQQANDPTSSTGSSSVSVGALISARSSRSVGR